MGAETQHSSATIPFCHVYCLARSFTPNYRPDFRREHQICILPYAYSLDRSYALGSGNIVAPSHSVGSERAVHSVERPQQPPRGRLRVVILSIARTSAAIDSSRRRDPSTYRSSAGASHLECGARSAERRVSVSVNGSIRMLGANLSARGRTCETRWTLRRRARTQERLAQQTCARSMPSQSRRMRTALINTGAT